MKRHMPRKKSSMRTFVIPLSLVLTVLLGIRSDTVIAQGAIESFTGFKRDSNAPINIEADTLDVNDKRKVAVFKGDVRAYQGTFMLRSKELRITYAGGNQGSAMGSDITKIEAKEKVLITSEGDQSASSEWAKFDVVRNSIEIGGNVVLTQGQNVLKCGTMVINLNTGKSRCNTRDGRVRGIFSPKNSIKVPRSRTN